MCIRDREAIYTYASKNITPVIIIDEVQFISNSILDDLRLILNFEMDSKNLCILILCGQPKLVIQLSRQPHEALRQRISINYTFSGLSRTETQEYIKSRFKAVSYTHLFKAGARFHIPLPCHTQSQE